MPFTNVTDSIPQGDSAEDQEARPVLCVGGTGPAVHLRLPTRCGAGPTVDGQSGLRLCGM